MAYGNNRAGQQTKAHFHRMGGTVIKFRHPYLAGALKVATGASIDTVDISSCLKQEGQFFSATQAQDSATQVRLIDGSVVTITNRFLNGTIEMPVVQTTGLVGTGDFIAICQLIKTIGDSIGGLLWTEKHINGTLITRLYYGVTVKNCPDELMVGNDVPVYNIQLYYAGWIEVSGTSSDANLEKIWAVGNQQGVSGYFKPFDMQSGSTAATYAQSTTTDSTLTGDDVSEANNTEATKVADTAFTSYGYVSGGTAITAPATTGS